MPGIRPAKTPAHADVVRIAREEAAATGADLDAVLGFDRADGFDRGALNITARHRAWARIIRETGCSQYGLSKVVGCDRQAIRWAMNKENAA